MGFSDLLNKREEFAESIRKSKNRENVKKKRENIAKVMSEMKELKIDKSQKK